MDLISSSPISNLIKFILIIIIFVIFSKILLNYLDMIVLNLPFKIVVDNYPLTNNDYLVFLLSRKCLIVQLFKITYKIMVYQLAFKRTLLLMPIYLFINCNSDFLIKAKVLYTIKLLLFECAKLYLLII